MKLYDKLGIISTLYHMQFLTTDIMTENSNRTTHHLGGQPDNYTVVYLRNFLIVQLIENS